MDPISDKGFSFIEVLVATLILTTGLLSLLGVMAVGVERAASLSDSIIAREKAREAVESVHAARDTGNLSWPTIRNVAEGGVFVGGAQPLREPGTDGLINTADDALDVMESQRTPGPDGIMGNGDDVQRVLTDFTREIVIGDVPGNSGGINPNLRSITVNVRYLIRRSWRTYTLRTFVSSFS